MTEIAAIIFLSILSGMTTIIGVVLAMIFISLHELIALANKYKNPYLFVLGMVTSVFIYLGLGAIFPN